ncbi:MAG: hypothetical protein QXT19_01370 [Candidatus Woesearchaeota archaeon]
MKKIIAVLLLLALLAACAPREPTPFVEGTPVEIVQKYYAAWGAKDYKTMYTLVSDGWKAVEPTAHTEESFAKYLNGFYKSAKSIRLVFASEQSNTGSQSTVSAAVEVETLDGRFLLSNQTLTLRLKDNGWKLISPYGEFTDLS